MEQETNPQSSVQNEQSTTSTTPAAATSNSEVADHKLFAILGYILPFLFFVPMVQDSSKHNAFARFHADQQLSLLVVGIGIYVLGQMVYSMAYMLFVFIPLINLGLLVLAIMGVIHAVNGEMKALPIIGGFKLLGKLFK